MNEQNMDALMTYTYKVLRQTRFLDNSATLKWATTYSSHELLNIGGLYILRISKNNSFYRVESFVGGCEHERR